MKRNPHMYLQKHSSLENLTKSCKDFCPYVIVMTIATLVCNIDGDAPIDSGNIRILYICA